jgi:hypothetical protein
MTESYGFQFKVDATDAAKGWKQFESAVAGVFGALDKMEAHVEKTMKAVNSGTKSSAAGIKQLADATKSLSGVSVNGTAAKNITALGTAMKGFKAPSSAQIDNLKAFFKVLGTSGTGGGAAAARNIGEINRAMVGFKTPNASSVSNLRGFFEALNMLKPSGGLSRLGPMMASLSTISDFKAPSAAQIRNLESFIVAVNNLKVPTNAAQIASSLNQISTSAGAASERLKGVRGNINGFGWSAFKSGAHGAQIEMMGLQNAFSGTFQVGSLLRSLLGSLTIGELGRSFFAATQTANQFHSSMEVLGQTPAMQADTWERVRIAADHFGADISTYSEEFSRFSLAAHEAGLSVRETFKIFEGFQSVQTVMHLGTEQRNSVNLAIREIMDKGYVASQQVTKQLGMILPGVLKTAEEAWKKAGVSHDTFIEAMRKKEVNGAWFLDMMAKHLDTVYGPGVAEALKSPVQQFTILHNRIKELMMAISNGGSKTAFANLIKMTSDWLSPERVKNFAAIINEKLTTAVNKVAHFVKMIHDNWDSIKGPLSTVLQLTGRMMLMSAAFKFTQFLVFPLQNALKYSKELLVTMRAINVSQVAGGAGGVLKAINNPIKSAAPVMAEVLSLAGLAKLSGAMDAMKAKAAATGPAIISALTTPIEGGIAAAAGVIIAGLGGAFEAVTVSARASGMKLASDQYTTTEKIKGFFLLMGDGVMMGWHTVANFMNKTAIWIGDHLGIPFKDAGDFIATVFMGIAYTFAKVGEGIIAIAKGIGDGIGREMMAPIKMMVAASKGDFIGAGAEIGNLFGGGIVGGIKDHLAGIKFGGADFKNFQTNAGLGADFLLSKMGARGRGKGGSDNAPDVSKINDSYNTLTGDEQFDPLYHGADKAKKPKKGRHKKGPDLAAIAKADANAIDTFMKELDAKDPVAKFADEMTAKISKAAQALLGTKGFKPWFDQIKKGGLDSDAQFNLLIKDLGNTKEGQARLNDIAARYGVTVSELTTIMKRQHEIDNQHLKDLRDQSQFGAVLLKQKDDEIRLARVSTVQAAALLEVQKQINEWNKDPHNKPKSQEEINYLVNNIIQHEKYMDVLKQEREFYQNNGVNTYIRDLQTLGEVIHDTDKNFLTSMENELVSLGKTGKFSFSNLFGTIQDGLLKMASQNITSKIGGLLTSGKDTKNPTIFGGLFGKLFGGNTGFDSAAAGKRFDAQNVALYATNVTTDGKLITGPLGALLNGGVDRNGTTEADGSHNIYGNRGDNLQGVMDKALSTTAVKSGDEMTKTMGSSIHGLGGLFHSVFGGAIHGLGSTLQYIISGLGGGGGGGGLLGSLVGSVLPSIFGGGGIKGIGKNFSASAGLQASVKNTIASNPGIFLEGGYSNAPVSRYMGSGVSFAHAPHYAEGTHNTSGGMPAILHDNEAVIPLSRGRKVAVELTNRAGHGSGTTVNNVWNVQTPNADSFRKSQQQITGQMHRAASRATMRNHG